MTLEEKYQFVETLFQDQVIFKEQIFDIRTEQDAIEVMQMIAIQLIDGPLKNELNFKYIKKIEAISSAHIEREIERLYMSECLSFLVEELRFSKDMLKKVMTTQRSSFIVDLARESYWQHGDIILQYSAETFFEYLLRFGTPEAIPSEMKRLIIGNDSESLMLLSSNVRVIYSLEQLHSHLKRAEAERAKHLTKEQISLIQLIKLLEITDKESEKHRSLQEKYRLLEEKITTIRSHSLTHYNSTLKKVKEAIVSSLRRR